MNLASTEKQMIVEEDLQQVFSSTEQKLIVYEDSGSFKYNNIMLIEISFDL